MPWWRGGRRPAPIVPLADLILLPASHYRDGAARVTRWRDGGRASPERAPKHHSMSGQPTVSGRYADLDVQRLRLGDAPVVKRLEHGPERFALRRQAIGASLLIPSDQAL